MQGGSKVLERRLPKGYRARGDVAQGTRGGRVLQNIDHWGNVVYGWSLM